MATIINSKLGKTRGKTRIWIEGFKLLREDIHPGDRYRVEPCESGKLKIVIDPNGAYKVSKRTRSGVTIPIIDLSNREVNTLFNESDVVRISISSKVIMVSLHQSKDDQQSREKRLIDKLASNISLRVCSLFHGGGVLDHAVHQGLDDAGVESSIVVAVEREAKYLDASLKNNPHLWRDDSIVINSDIELVSLDNAKSMHADLLIAGIPCTGASRAGQSKNGLSLAEEHDKAGSLFFDVLRFIQSLKPSLVIIENVVEYQKTASMMVIRSVLNRLGYVLSEWHFSGNDFGCIENRNRLCVVASSAGLNLDIDLAQVKSCEQSPGTINDVLDDIPLNSDRWKSFDYLAEKEQRDLAAGKGFSRQLLDGSENTCGTIGRGYAKCRSTEPFLRHPFDRALCRIFTKNEHARLKKIPQKIVEGLSETIGHEVLGQSVIYPVFRDIARYIGHQLNKLCAVPTAA